MAPPQAMAVSVGVRVMIKVMEVCRCDSVCMLCGCCGQSDRVQSLTILYSSMYSTVYSFFVPRIYVSMCDG